MAGVFLAGMYALTMFASCSNAYDVVEAGHSSPLCADLRQYSSSGQLPSGVRRSLVSTLTLVLSPVSMLIRRM